MCGYINNKKTLVAKEDITCYKVLEVIVDENTGQTTYRSPNFTDHQYRIGETYKETLGLIRTKSHCTFGKYRTTTGLYSFETISIAQEMCMEWNYMFYKDFALFECIIPKGSQYYKSLDSQITQLVSDQLQVIRIIKERQ